MSQAPLVVIVEPDSGRRKILSLLMRAATPVELCEFARFEEAEAVLRKRTPRIILCPWSEGGSDLLAERIANHDGEPRIDSPHLVLLTHDISPGMIGAAIEDGRTDLIPSDPLNLNALRNRVLLCLEGPSGLAVRVSRTSAALRRALDSLPGLRRRLAA